MANKSLVKELGLSPVEVDRRVSELIEAQGTEQIDQMYETALKELKPETIVKGRVLNIVSKEVLVDIGYKAEGVIPLEEFGSPDEVKVGEEIDVFLEEIEDETGMMILSKQKADRIRGWERLVQGHKENDVLKGRVVRKIKGGLLVDVGHVLVFLPASQVDIRKVDEIGDFVGKDIECKIIKIDQERLNVIVSRKQLIEEARAEKKAKLLAELKEGDIVQGVVKHIADFGAFVDLGGLDGLLYITDMNWSRVNHPSEIVALDQEVTVKIIKIDHEQERVALGMKQLTKNPWEGLAAKYPVGSKARGKVVNLLPYGAFVELEPGIEGLVHISELSWTKRINHPSEVTSIGEMVDVVVLNVNLEKQEIALGVKQTQPNPWDTAVDRYPSGTKVTGRVRYTTNYGAFLELEDSGLEGLLHVNDISWTRKVMHPAEVLKKGEKVEVVILTVEPDRKRMALGLKQLTPNPWETTFPVKYAVGNVVQGQVKKLLSYGAFVGLEKDLEGLLHITKPKEDEPPLPEIHVGDLLEVKVVKFEPAEGRIAVTLLKVVECKREGGASSPAAPATTVPAPKAKAN